MVAVRGRLPALPANISPRVSKIPGYQEHVISEIFVAVGGRVLQTVLSR